MRSEDKERVGRRVWRCLGGGLRESGEWRRYEVAIGEQGRVPKPGSEACLPGSTIGPLVGAGLSDRRKSVEFG